MKYKGTLNLEWEDGSENEAYGIFLWVCRGALMASNAVFATMWNEEGFEICKYQK